MSNEEHRYRLKKLQDTISQKGMDVFLVTTPDNIYYLTGLTYAQQERPFFLVVQPKEAEKYIVPELEKSHLDKYLGAGRIISYTEYPAKAGKRWQDALLECVSGMTTIGVEPDLNLELYKALDAEKTVILTLIEQQRLVKSDTEIEKIRQCARYCDQAVSHVVDSAYYGVTELELFSQGRKIQKQILQETVYDPVTTSILVGSWVAPDSAIPHSIPKVDDVLKDGPHIALGYLRVNGYAAENERTYFLSPPEQEIQRAFSCMLKARRMALGMVRPGVAAAEIDSVVRSFLTKEGYGENILHRAGHGIGISNHEGPWLAEGSDDVLAENMVISIEPGLYFQEIGGVRHSDTVLITQDGYEMLTSYPVESDTLTITSRKPLKQLRGKIMNRMLSK
ncbi:M24 family metallopeptidase [Desulforhopalus sp. 52FAK]